LLRFSHEIAPRKERRNIEGVSETDRNDLLYPLALSAGACSYHPRMLLLILSVLLWSAQWLWQCLRGSYLNVMRGRLEWSLLAEEVLALSCVSASLSELCAFRRGFVRDLMLHVLCLDVVRCRVVAFRTVARGF